MNYNNPDGALQNSWIVYINGVEVPANSVNVSSGVWRFSEATINLAPDRALSRLGHDDRLPVQVFYCDHFQGDKQFRLLFDGEIVSYQYVNTNGRRQMSFQCVDYMQIFTQLFFFFMSSVDNITSGTSGQQIGATPTGINTAGFAPIYPYSIFAQGLISPDGPNSESQPYVKRPIDIVYNVIRGLIGSSVEKRSIPAINFFSPWIRKTGFHRRFTALPYLEDATEEEGAFPILKAVQADWAMAAVSRLASSINTSGSLWDVFTQIFQTLMVEFCSLPAPSAVSSDFETLLPQSLTDGDKFLTNYVVKPQFLFGLPPVCNVLFPSQESSFAYNEDYATQPTRVYYSEEALMQYLNTENTAGPGMSTLIRDALSVAFPIAANDAMRAALESDTVNGKNLLTVEEYFRGPVVLRRELPRWFLFLQQANQPNTPTTPTDSSLFQLYAKYEYFKEKYARRKGTATTPFNPYPVAGFPCAVFEDIDTEQHIFGYLMQVNHSLSDRGCTSQFSYSYARTMSEMFAELREQFDTENEELADLEPPETPAGATEEVEVQEDGTVQSQAPRPVVGAIAISPPEPIQEIRDLVQNFDRAEAFYKSLLWASPVQPQDEISTSQLQEEATRRNFTGPQQLYEETLQLPDMHVFRYDKVLQFEQDNGNPVDIRIQGLDTTSRDYVLGLLTRMESEGDLTEEELESVRTAVGRSELQQQDPQNRSENLTLEIESIREAVESAPVISTVNGRDRIVPRPEAAYLFNSHHAAMRFGARPICTLEQYIDFHENGIREGRVEPGTQLATGRGRVPGAPYYVRIRDFTAGPPETLPGAGQSDGDIDSVPEEFPDNSRDWTSILLGYRQRVLERVPPRR